MNGPQQLPVCVGVPPRPRLLAPQAESARTRRLAGQACEGQQSLRLGWCCLDRRLGAELGEQVPDEHDEHCEPDTEPRVRPGGSISTRQ